MKNQLPKNIRALRKDRTLTQEQLAEAMNVSIGAVSKWELGQSLPEISILIKLADFFDASVDALLGYELRSNNREHIVKRIKAYQNEKNFDEGKEEAEKALKKYPNSFDVVYASAQLYSLLGIELRNKKILTRAIELLHRSCTLINQNTDEDISELTIQITIAETYMSMGDTGKALAGLKKHNPCGINDSQIGMILASGCHKPDEALPFLSKALLKNLCTQIRISVGYTNAFIEKKDYQSALDILLWTLSIFPGLKIIDKPCALEKTEAVLLAAAAQMHYFLNQPNYARDFLCQAKTVALHFDENPNYKCNSIRFSYDNEPFTIYDDMGATAIEGIELTLQDEDVPKGLIKIWKEVLNDEN